MTARIYHITSGEAWQHAQATGTYTPETYAEEGFIHCSYAHQVVAVANATYRGHQGLLLLGMERFQLPCK